METRIIRLTGLLGTQQKRLSGILETRIIRLTNIPGTQLMRLTGILVVVLMIMAGCKSGKTISDETTLSRDERKILEQAIAAQPSFNSIDIKKMNMSLNISGSNPLSSPATCRIIRDSVVHISVQPFFGIEMAVAQFTNTRFVVLDKMRKVAYTGDYSLFSERFGIALNYKAIEALITNQLFVIDSPNAALTRLKPQQKDGKAFLTHTTNNIRLQFELNPENRIRNVDVTTTTNSNQRFTAEYENFTNIDQLAFPFQYKVNITTASRKVDVAVGITRMTVNEQLSIPEISLQGYRIGIIDQLLK